MTLRTLAGFSGELLAAWILAVTAGSQTASAQTGPAPPSTMLDLAIQVAERDLLPEVRQQTNLTWKAEELARIVGLYGRAGRFAEGVERVESVESSSVGTKALGTLAVDAIQAGDIETAMRLVGKLQQIEHWTVSTEFRAIAVSLRGAGRAEPASSLVRTIADPRERALALVEEARWLAALGNGDAASKALDEARPLAAGIPHGGVHVPDWGARQATLYEIFTAELEIHRPEQARRTLQTLSKASNLAGDEWRVRGLVEMARDAAARGERDRALNDLDEARGLARSLAHPRPSHFGPTTGQNVITLGQVSAAVETLRGVARELHGLGQANEAGEALNEANAALAVFDPEESTAAYALPKLVELRVRLAASWRELGKPEEATRVLASAEAAAARIPASESSDRAAALSWIAAAKESASDSKAQRALTEAVTAIQQTPAGQPRAARWQTLSEAFVEFVSADQAVEILSTFAAGDEDLYFAVDALAETLLPTLEPERLAPLLEVMPVSWSQIRHRARLASRLDELGRHTEADVLVDDALHDLADRPEGWQKLLVVLALEAPRVDETGSQELRGLPTRLKAPLE